MAVRVTVVGGGIAGIAAALRLIESGAQVTLIEGSERLGGKLHTAADGIETGAETFLLRGPTGGPSAALRLVHDLGLADQLVHPGLVPPALWLDGALRTLPRGTLLGIPGPDSDASALVKIIDADQDLGGPVLAPGQDVTVGELVRSRLGDEVVQRLVDPLLGGVYAGRADDLSIEATMPGLHRLLSQEHTLTGAVASAMSASRAHRPASEPDSMVAALPPSAIFGTLRDGLGALVEAAQRNLLERGAQLRFGEPVRALRRAGAGWEIDRGGAWSTADAVVLAVPAGKAARLLEGAFPDVAGEIGRLEYGSVALVTLLLPRLELPDLSGFLAPEDQGLTIKAATFFGQKWEHHRRPQGPVPVRASIGRAGQAQMLQRPDQDLIAAAHRDLSTVLGQVLSEPVLARVQRWGGGLPQYGVGHVGRVRAARERLSDANIALAGAGFDGVGIPACASSGFNAAEHVLEGSTP